MLQGQDNARDGVAIFRNFDPKAASFDIFVAGLSGETTPIQLPVPIEVTEEGPDGKERKVKKTKVFLTKTLRLNYTIGTEAAQRNIAEETSWPMPQVEALASYVHDIRDIGAGISSGSFETMGMVVIPCTIKTMSAIATSYNTNLLIRAADVTLKEKRRLVLVIRETPLHLGHLRRMVELAETGAVILPPMPAFYHQPKTIEDLIDQTVGKVLDQFQIKHNLFRRWTG